MPPPERVIPDRRREMEDEDAENEVREAVESPDGAEESDLPVEAGEREERHEGSWARWLPEDADVPRIFADRTEAGLLLARRLRDEGESGVAVILGIPRGGVEVGAVIARELDAPLDVVIPRKVGAPGNPELGLGAIAEGVRVLDQRLIRTLGVTEEYLDREILAQEEEIRRRERAYRGDRPPVAVTGLTAVVVDDGVATGGTAMAAVLWAKRSGAGSVVFAAPVAPADAVLRLAEEADRVTVLLTPEHFFAVGQWYADFPQVADQRVVELLRTAAGPGP